MAILAVASFGSALGLDALGLAANAANLASVTAARTAVAVTAEPGVATIGDRIWADVNHNGIQDPAETGINGITVRFVQGTQELASTVTSNSPVDGSPGWYQLTRLPSGVTGKILLDRVGDYLPGGSLVARVLSTPAAGNDRNLDSNGTQPGYGFVQIDPVTTGSPGPTNTTYDIGFAPAAALINQIWFDANSNGRHDPEEPGINGVRVSIFDGVSHQLLGDTLSNADPTDPNRKGVCFFDGLPADRPWRIELNNPKDFAEGGPLSGVTLTTSHAPSTTETNDSDAANIGGVATVTKVSATGNYSLNFTGDIGFRPLRQGEAQPLLKPITKPATSATLPMPTSPSAAERPTSSAPSTAISAQNTEPSTKVESGVASSPPPLVPSPNSDVPDDVTVSVEGSPEASSTTVKDRGRVIHDHSLILALTTDSIVPETLAPNPAANPTVANPTVANPTLPNATVANSTATSPTTVVSPAVLPPKRTDSSSLPLPMAAGGLVLLGLSGLLLARRFM